MADIAPSLATATVPPIDVAELWSSLVDFSNYSPVALEPKPNTRSAAVTIILRFTRGGQVLDLNMLSSNDGLLNDSGLITAGTRRSALPLEFRPVPSLLAQFQSFIAKIR